MEKVALIFPTKNREHFIDITTVYTHYYVKKQLGAAFEIIVVDADQSEFNYGFQVNLGYFFARELGCDYLVVNDIDQLPSTIDYRPKKIDIIYNLGKSSMHKYKDLDDNANGINMFHYTAFCQINGYSNLFRVCPWYIDRELFRRITNAKVPYVKLDARMESMHHEREYLTNEFHGMSADTFAKVTSNKDFSSGLSDFNYVGTSKRYKKFEYYHRLSI